MDIIYRTTFLFFLMISTLLAASCNREPQPKQKPAASNHNTTHYSNAGLSLDYPKHWKFIADEFSLYADRGLNFDIQETSRASVYIYSDHTMELSKIAAHLERELQLNSGNYIKNYQRTDMYISGFSALKLVWQDTMTFPFTSEITIIKITDSPHPVFVVFQLLAEDIVKESSSIVSFINSISVSKELEADSPGNIYRSW